MIHMRMINTQEYISMLRELVEEGREVSMLISGNSMSPYLVHARDSIQMKKPDRDLKKGDMVFFQRESGQYVMHRIVKITQDGFYMLGDAQTQKEGPIRREQIFALITSVKRRGEWEKAGNFWWEFFAHIWIHLVFIRRPLIRLYGVGREIVRKGSAAANRERQNGD